MRHRGGHHQEGRPVDGVELQDVLPNDVDVRGPAMYLGPRTVPWEEPVGSRVIRTAITTLVMGPILVSQTGSKGHFRKEGGGAVWPDSRGGGGSHCLAYCPCRGLFQKRGYKIIQTQGKGAMSCKQALRGGSQPWGEWVSASSQKKHVQNAVKMPDLTRVDFLLNSSCSARVKKYDEPAPIIPFYLLRSILSVVPGGSFSGSASFPPGCGPTLPLAVGGVLLAFHRSRVVVGRRQASFWGLGVWDLSKWHPFNKQQREGTASSKRDQKLRSGMIWLAQTTLPPGSSVWVSSRLKMQSWIFQTECFLSAFWHKYHWHAKTLKTLVQILENNYHTKISI